MSERLVRSGKVWAAPSALALLLAILVVPARSTGPIDAPQSSEPRVKVGKNLAKRGLLSSQGLNDAFERVRPGESVYSRDLLVALPGFQADIVPASKGVKLTLFGNLPEMSDSHVLESAVVLHDTSHYDIDFTHLRGRIILTNTKEKGEAKAWLRTDTVGVQFTLAAPGDQVAVEIYGRWAPGMPFSLRRSDDNEPIILWDVYALKGRLDIKAGPNEWRMAEPPGRAHFHGDSLHGPARSGPQIIKELPAWADAKAAKSPILKRVAAVVAAYAKAIDERETKEVPGALLKLAAGDKDSERAGILRRLVVFAMAATDNVDRVAELLGASKDDTIRKTAVIALRHWIGAREGRDEKLYHTLIDHVGYSKAEAETLLQLLHSPFAPEQAETYETLIAYLRHRKQAVRELAHWHLVRLAPIGRKIPFDASADAAVREKAVEEWKKLVPPGELPKDPPDDTKDKDKKKKKADD